jgi:GDPmannose 4,6-dehydratase
LNKKALITGITGQDGAYLAKLLIDKGYHVFGAYRRLSTPNFWRLKYLNIIDKVNLIPFDLTDMPSIVETLKICQPTEIYNLGAQSFVGASFEQPIYTVEATGVSVTKFLEAIRQVSPKAKLYQASTSEMFGDGHNKPINENTVFQPSSPYATAKLYAHQTVNVYREAYNIFACCGILFNHESPLRGLEFVTRKITNEIGKIKIGLSEKLSLGNLNALRDWGFAPDYVRAMWLMLQNKDPEDFVISTNETHSVKEFINLAFEMAGINPDRYVVVDKKFIRPLDVSFLLGDYKKAQKKLNWTPTVFFNDLVKIMVDADIKRWQSWKKGKFFPWDAFNYPSEQNLISTKIKMDV